jgi:hypothetical protein
MAQDMRDRKIEKVQDGLTELAEIPEWQLFVSKLQAILNGDRNPKLADDPNLYFEAVVELRLLLESQPEKRGGEESGVVGDLGVLGLFCLNQDLPDFRIFRIDFKVLSY